jgi:hypothetical protein
MTEPTLVISQPKKRGRPKKNPDIIGPDGKTTEKPRPSCESFPQKFERIKVTWGVTPATPGYKRKGVAIVYDPEHKGGQVIVIPVKEEEGKIWWRYRWVPGVPSPFRYERLELEPGEFASMRNMIDEATKEWFGGQRGADQTSVDFLKSRRDDNLGKQIRDEKIF